jgi:TonB family protein
LTGLRYLNIGENAFASLPEPVCRLSNLIELRATDNLLTSLPDSIGRLSRLRELHVRNNRLVSLPDSVGALQELRQIDLRGNPLIHLPAKKEDVPFTAEFKFPLRTCNLGNTFHVYFSIRPVLNRRALVFTFAVACAALAGPAAAGSPTDDEPVFDIGPGITPPRVTHQVSPVNKPDDSRGFRLSGTVLVGLVVSSKGEPKDVHVVKSLDKDIDQSAVDAVQKWHFEPAKKGDQPVAVRISVEIRFHSL